MYTFICLSSLPSNAKRATSANVPLPSLHVACCFCKSDVRVSGYSSKGGAVGGGCNGWG